MAFSIEEYTRLLLKLFPIGRAWAKNSSSTLYKVCQSLAQELHRLDLKIDELIQEQDPRKTNALLADHERDLGLPDECTEIETTLELRRKIAYAKYVMEGGLNQQTYVDFAEDLGFIITIEGFKPCWSGEARSGDEGGDQKNIFYIKININASNAYWYYFSCGISASGDQLIHIGGTTELQCIFNKYKPAHNVLIWNYYGNAFSTAFSSDFDAVPSGDEAFVSGAFSRAFDNSFSRYIGGGEFDNAFNNDFYKRL